MLCVLVLTGDMIRHVIRVLVMYDLIVLVNCLSCLVRLPVVAFSSLLFQFNY
jgi:hypothetical protein